ncbi:heavy-metal-associated domain-containing protein [Roseateles saccharophilus]|uniref:Copper chaperone n=1 Tax=Roseateles saccharophilus TaxID=304 RepID=A0A4R3UUG1_ROSSA|nr:heavy-metal-associated domain-containing protein [Roseateles saccharophilus]MBL8277972.1 heavy-metal-associated domain-containing protein [Roseateles sp.]MDG0833134.1 copper chaperone [Roseateles saccharophilus]TCU94601.1 copper chaperone [Roseateles saccharophilus]
MITFEVSDMTCGHCASTITKAVKSVDQGARVAIDVASHRVQIEPTEADATELLEAIKEAGYSPVEVAQPAEAAPSTGKKGCCCG